jgi:predicted NAD/FAD-binding protein
VHVTGRKIAVVGSGVSGMTAGYILSHNDYVTMFEADGRLGGHADTHLVTPPSGPPVGVDTGFIVYNERTYPLLTRLLAELGVATQPSEMSMSVRCAGCGLQYAGHRGLAGLTPGLIHGRGLDRARYLRMLTEIPRFHRAARRELARPDSARPDSARPDSAGTQTLGEFLRARRFGPYFTAHFALPLVAAVWSCPPGTALRYPARYLFAFLANHGMLSVSGAPPWRTVTGGSRHYVERAAKRLHDIRLSTPVRTVRRHPDGVELADTSGETHRFDAVVVATHPDQALRLLDAPTGAEREVLGAFSYTENPALLHTDGTLLPRHPGIRASWNYEIGGCRPGDGPAPRISYDMNRLQSLPAAQDYIVTLGGAGTVDPGLVIDRMDYAHPAYTPAAVAAQRRLPELNTSVTAFAGAYHGWGFHEDGCRSGVQAARALGGTW